MPTRMNCAVVAGLCLSASAFATGTALVTLESPAAGQFVLAGSPVVWTIRISVSGDDNSGLAGFTCDLVQDPNNPVLFDIPRGDPTSVPGAMANFDRPAGLTYPPDRCTQSGYFGAQRGTPGQMNLLRIGGAQNTSGVAAPPGSGEDENADVTQGIGQDNSPQIVLSGSFPAPDGLGRYTFTLENVTVNVLTSVGTPPQSSTVDSATLDLSGASFDFLIAPAVCPGDMNCDGSVNFKDINPFVSYLSDNANWQATYFDCNPQNGDINGDGTYPSFRDINPFVTMLSSTAPLVPCSAQARSLRTESFTFSRSSVAYVSDYAGVTEIPVDTPRTVPVAVATVADGTVYRNEADGVADIAPHCQNSRYLFGMRTNRNQLYRSTDGVNWVGYPPYWSAYWSYIFATANDSLLAVNISPIPAQIYRSTDDGATWTRCLTLTNAGMSAINIQPWGFHQAPNGTMLLVEYAGPGLGTPYKVYRSDDDGQTWSVVLTDTTITHFHAVGYHAATGQWLVANGDGVYKGIRSSSDDGLTWQVVQSEDTSFAQPCWFQDIGDPSRIWLGGDDASQVAYLDVLPSSPGYKEVVSVFNSYDPRSLRGYTFQMLQHGPVIYACNTDNTNSAGPHYPVILASLDGFNWVTAYQFRAAEPGLGYAMGARYAGFAGGKLHFTYEFTGINSFSPKFCHFAMTPVDVSSLTGTLLEPGVHNYFNAVQSGCEHATNPTLADWFRMSGSLTVDAGNKHERTKSVHWYYDTSGYGSYVARVLDPNAVSGKNIYFRGRFKGQGRGFTGSWRNLSTPLDWDKLANSGVSSSREGTWIEHVGLPTAIGAPSNLDYLIQGTSLTAADSGHKMDLWIDTIQAAEVPITTWQMGSTTTENDRAAEHLQYSGLGLQSNWTCAWRLVLTNSPGDLTFCSNKQYLFTIRRDVCNYASVYYDPQDSAIKLESYVQGTVGEPVEATPLVGWTRNMLVNVVVRCSGGRAYLSVAAAHPMENVANSVPATLGFADAWLTGDVDGYSQMPLILIDHVVVPNTAVDDSVLIQPDYFAQLQALAGTP